MRPELVRLIAPDFEITEESLRAAITDRTRAMIVCTPNNPSGRRLTAAELIIISAVAEERDLLVITDEVYEDIYFGSDPEKLMSVIRIAAESLVVCAPTPLQELGARALRLGDEYYHDLRAMYDAKRRALAEGFTAAGLSPNEPQGSYYLFVDCSPMGVANGAEAADVLLQRNLIGTVPGEAFYLNPPELPYVRVCFSLPDEVISEAVDRLASGGLSRG